MGLLDSLNSQDGIFALGLLDAAAPKPVRTNIGGGLLSALGQAQAWKQAQEDRQQKAAMQALQSQLLQAQIGETQAQAQQRTADAEKLKQAMLRQQAFQTALGQTLGGTTPAQALTAGGGPTVANAAQIGQQRPTNWTALSTQFPEQIDLIEKLSKANNFGRQKVARTIDGKDSQGRPVTVQQDEFGGQVGDAIQQWKAPDKVDTGGQVQFIDPVTLARLGQVGKTQSPDSAASNAVAWANNAVARQRLNFDMQQPRGQYDSERGLMIDPRSNVATPVTVGGQPIGPKSKDLTDSQAKALLFGQRASEADKLLSGLSARGTDMPGLIKQSAETTPFIGGTLGSAVNVLPGFLGGPSADQQSVEQAQRDFLNAVLRRESGAVISPSEFDNARRQYFPQVGDSAQVRAQKAANRKLATELMLREVPSGQRSRVVDFGELK